MKIANTMKRSLLYIAIVVAAVTSCGNSAARKEAEREAAVADSLAKAQAEVSASAINPQKEKKASEIIALLPEEPVFDIITSMGTIKVKLYKDTPRHRDNFERLALSGYYDSLLFHRVINNFMIQGGDPFTRDTSLVDRYGNGGPGYNIPAELRDGSGAPLHRHKKGALAAARKGDMANPMKESSGSQFYLVQNPDNCTHLDGEYTVFGETVAGLNVIDRIASAQTNKRDLPLQPIRIITIKPDDELNAMAQNSQEN